MRHTQWRDCQAWKDEGLPLTTTSSEAAKLYDACLTQGWYDEPELGGLAKSCELMYKADPEFVMGSALLLGLQLARTVVSITNSTDLKQQYEAFKANAEKQRKSLTQREIQHVEAISLWAEGKVLAAAKIFEEILLDHPTDLHALKIVDIIYFYIGDFKQLRDSCARVLPVLEAKGTLLKSYVYGMYAYGLEETLQYQKAEKCARKSLEEMPQDGWATHALAHVFEMEGRTSEGLEFLDSTVKNWEFSNHLACHNHWHRALYYFENENYESAVEVLEKEVLPRSNERKNMLDVADCSSLLWRLNLMSPSSTKKSHWDHAVELCQPHSKNHITAFNDAHFMMAFAGSGDKAKVDELLETLPERGSSEFSDHPLIIRPLLESIACYRDEKYGKVVELLEPIRTKLTHISGSNAQRDVFNLMLISAALKSGTDRNKKFARVLINEREATKTTGLNRTLINLAK